MKNTIDIIVETPKASTIKFDFDKKTGKYKLDKFLPLGMSFPYDFGFIPNTLGEDGDPLDVIMISECGTFAGCLIQARIIGCMQAKQSEKSGSKKMIRNDRYIAVPQPSLAYKDVVDIDDLSKEIYKELTDFFCNYNKIAGKEFYETGKVGKKRAMKQIVDGLHPKNKKA